MKKACDDWKSHFPPENYGARFFPEFEKRARDVAAEVFRVKTPREGGDIALDLARQAGARKVVSVSSPLQEAAGIETAFKDAGIEFYSDQNSIATHAATADIGISCGEFGIAESGSICQDVYAIESRLVSTLPPVHMVFLDSNLIVAGISEAFEIVSRVFDRGYITFITGPSRTADIEVVLTIGVHGPMRLVIIAVDEKP